MKPFQATANYLRRQNLRYELWLLMSFSIETGRLHPDVFKPLNRENLSLLTKAKEAGLLADIKPGVVDKVIATPELAMALIEAGAVPGEAFLDNVLNTIKPTAFQPIRWIADIAKNDPLSNEANYMALVMKAAEKHPQLDWLRVQGDTTTIKSLYAATLCFHFPKLIGVLSDAREREGISFAPLHADTEVLDELLDQLLTRRSYMNTSMFNLKQTRQMVAGLLDAGADPNRRTKPFEHEPELCVIARAMRKGLDDAEIVLQHGAKVDEQSLLDALFVMHDRQEILGWDHDLVGNFFCKMLEQSGLKLDPQAIVPSNDYYQPTVQTILQTHYPKVLDVVRWKREFQQMDEATPEIAEPAARGPRRRL